MTEDGLRIEVLATSVTCDRRIEAGDLVTIHYVGKLLATGEVFESSDVVGEPLKFVIGEKIFIDFENLCSFNTKQTFRLWTRNQRIGEGFGGEMCSGLN